MLIWQICSNAQQSVQVRFSLLPSIPPSCTPLLPWAYPLSNPALGRSQHEGAKKGFLHAMFEARRVSNFHGGWDDEGGEGDGELEVH